MNGFELQRERERVGISIGELSEGVVLSEDQLREWERGGGRIRKRDAELIEWHLAHASRRNEMAKAGIPECKWVAQWGDEFDSEEIDDEAHLAKLESHSAQCDTCLRRRDFESRLPKLPRFPGYAGPVEFGLDVLAGFDRLRGRRRLVTYLGLIACLLGAARLLRHLPPYEPLSLVLYLAGLVSLVVLTPNLVHQ